MIRALLACGGGMSSSALTWQANKSLKQYGLEDQMHFTFSPLMLVKESDIDNFDVVFCCPHLLMHLNKFNSEVVHNRIPVYVLPPRMYGVVDGRDLYEDAQDIMKQFESQKQNPVYFPGEEKILKVSRRKSHRRTAN